VTGPGRPRATNGVSLMTSESESGTGMPCRWVFDFLLEQVRVRQAGRQSLGEGSGSRYVSTTTQWHWPQLFLRVCPGSSGRPSDSDFKFPGSRSSPAARSDSESVGEYERLGPSLRPCVTTHAVTSHVTSLVQTEPRRTGSLRPCLVSCRARTAGHRDGLGWPPWSSHPTVIR
jgi:hypothetical protein